MRIGVPACLIAVALLGGAALSGCQNNDRAQRDSPAMQDYEQRQDRSGDAMRPQSVATAPRQEGAMN